MADKSNREVPHCHPLNILIGAIVSRSTDPSAAPSRPSLKRRPFGKADLGCSLSCPLFPFGSQMPAEGNPLPLPAHSPASIHGREGLSLLSVQPSVQPAPPGGVEQGMSGLLTVVHSPFGSPVKPLPPPSSSLSREAIFQPLHPSLVSLLNHWG